MHITPRTANAILLAERYHRILLGMPQPAEPEPEGPFENEEERYWYSLLNSVRSLSAPPPAYGYYLPAMQAFPCTGAGITCATVDNDYGFQGILGLQFAPLPANRLTNQVKTMELETAGQTIGTVFFDEAYTGRPISVMLLSEYLPQIGYGWFTINCEEGIFPIGTI
ncbi:hypothetical protein GCM10023185_13110 [Hymenobacter saemangeumensis]|uniref:Uncharacterized protein n=1 Tax=Hymenobacter saemangeumensis TaxID=1084522 RepID=A0ABP8I7E4_9BACT